MRIDFRYLLLSISLLGCQGQAQTGLTGQFQNSAVPRLELATTLPNTSVYSIGNLRGSVTREAAPEGYNDSPASVWEGEQPVAVWGSLGDYRWVYPLVQGEGGQPSLESMTQATYALVSDMWLIPSSNLTARREWPALPQSALYLPAQNASCPWHLLQRDRLVPQGRLQASAEGALMSRGVVGGYLAFQNSDGHTELVSSSCTQVGGRWTSSSTEESLAEPPENTWRNGRSSDVLLEPLISHRFGQEMLIEAPEELPQEQLADLALRQPLCQGQAAQQSDTVRVKLYGVESFVLQILAKLPVVLRQQLQPYWDQVLNTALGQEWLQHFDQPTNGEAIDAGMQELQQCNDASGPGHMARNLASLRTSTEASSVTKTRHQLQHVAFENRLLQATQLLNEAARRYEKDENAIGGRSPAYRFHRKRFAAGNSVAFSLMYFDGRQSLATQTVPGTEELVFTRTAWTGLARSYGQREYLVNLDAARMVDMLETKLQEAMQARGTSSTANWSAADFRAATHMIRSMKDPSWSESFVNALFVEFERSSLATDYELRVNGLTTQDNTIQFHLMPLTQDVSIRAKRTWRRLLLARHVATRAQFGLGVKTVEGPKRDQEREFTEALLNLIDACGGKLDIPHMREYLTFHRQPRPSPAGYYYVFSFNWMLLASVYKRYFETIYDICMPLVADTEVG